LAQEQDSAWKEVLDNFFEEFLRFFFTEIHQGIDWSRGFEFLDKELEPILRDAEIGKQITDKLVKVHILDGSETWILIHIEVQGQPEEGFPRRIYHYNSRIELRYDRDVVSLAVLTDRSRSFRPEIHERRSWGFELTLRFPVVKVIDYEDRRAELEVSPSPFAIVVLAHLDSWKAESDGERFDMKFRLARRLFERGFERNDIMALLRFMDWLVRLPRDQEEELCSRIRTEIEGKSDMPYLSNFERFAMERGEQEGFQKGKLEGKLEGKAEGKAEGLLDAITLGIKLRFGEPGIVLLPRIRAIKDPDRLQRLVDTLHEEGDLERFKAFLETLDG
jgi:hypothetical protein